MSRMTFTLHDLPEGRRGQILAVTILGIAVLILWLAVLGPLAGLYITRSAQLGMDRETVTRMAHLRAILPHLRQTAARVPHTPPMLIEGESDAIAGATLQNSLSQIATESGADIGSSETLATMREGAYRRIGLHITLTAPYPSLARFLASVQEASPAMIVETLHLHASEAEGNAPDAMTCDMNVFAYRRDIQPASSLAGSAP
ncbi:type II secretion system protein GspM [Asaia krungthepensis]|uniref:General secretion pathway protein M n=1 Tax=Asaia krungthepensis NRIC 0535 TaxID=1307925 RepID=A0ABQ0Q248_9PROT|nr:type II secretion system protein GspM [Asaia krungthepensis]GBQ87715.1 general secretion pathway protein M [Asaia krungthepensis NRIC 0535]